MSAAPALLRWIRSRHPGVSRRQRSSSGVGVRVAAIIVTKGRRIAPCAQVVVSSFPFPRQRRGPDTALRFKRNVLPGPLFRVGTTEAGDNTTSLDEVPYHKPHIRRSLGESSHVPREPMRPVADQHPHRYPLALERTLLGGADAVQHVYLVGARRRAEPEGPLAQPRDEAEVVSAEHRTRPAARGALEQPPGEHGIGGVHIALFRQRYVRRFVVGALHEADGGREREQGL